MQKGYGNYDKYPEVKVTGYDDCAVRGYEDICSRLKEKIGEKKNAVLVFECYPGVDTRELIEGISRLEPQKLIFSEDCMLPEEELTRSIQENLTDDRVFGIMTKGELKDFFVPEKLQIAAEEVKNAQGLTVVYGAGASLITKGDILVYCDLARWEIQLRYRKGMGNLHSNNGNDPQLSKYKRGFFVEWRMADKLKRELYGEMDFLLDTNTEDDPKMVTGEAFLEGISRTAKRPFRVVPYFDPGVWGGQWMKSVCGLPKDTPNFAWSFDGVPEENSLYLRYGDIRIEVPSINVVFLHPGELLGERVYKEFGAEFPIRFDFLDTVGGENLSLQVHPMKEYIREKFGMKYTQDESYYILDCPDEGSCVYLGIKEGAESSEMISALKEAQAGGAPFDAERFVNKIPVKKHDHVLIPAGTVHCSGKDSMVLEISATPYIFTFKLWDWGRLGLDGLPRPIHIEHGEKNIQWNRTTPWVIENLVNREQTLSEKEGVTEEKTGLHELEFIETRRHRFTKEVLHRTEGSVNVLNLVEGSEALVVSPAGSFEPFTVHYAETFIIPSCVEEYIIKPTDKSAGETLMTVKAYVR